MARSALDQISTVVNAAALDGGFDRDEAHLSRIALVVDERGFTELSKELRRVVDALPKIEAASRKRLASADHEGEQRVTVVTMLFENAEPMIARAAQPHTSSRSAAKKRSRSKA